MQEQKIEKKKISIIKNSSKICKVAIKNIDTSISELCKELNISKATFYKSYKKGPLCCAI